MTKLGPYSRTDAFNAMDRRTWQAKLLARTRAELTEQVGGRPSAVQRGLIDRAAWLTLHVAQIEHRTAEGRVMTQHDSNQYLAWSNALARTLARIGPLSAAPRMNKTLAEHIAERTAAA